MKNKGTNKTTKVEKNKKTLVSKIAAAMLVFMLIFWGISSWFGPTQIDTSEGLDLLKNQKITRIVVNDVTQQVNLTLTKSYQPKDDYASALGMGSGATRNVYFTFSKAQSAQVDELAQKADPARNYNVIYPIDNWFSALIQTLLPLLILVGIMGFFLNRMQGGVLSKFGGKSRFKDIEPNTSNVRFRDVAGADEAVEELAEIQEFLSDPQRFHRLGARIPKGVLLCGPPGTGKTLLAKAVAGEANVPFFRLSGSDFVELYVGMGASRVRSLFENAKSKAPAIIFVDEIDAIGRRRGGSAGSASEEREQTLNQLLVEMDGFEETTNIILMAATNRPDVLDPALLRPGRFDRQVNVDVPDFKGRRRILEVHAENKPLTIDVDFDQIAKRTPGFSGADLANVLNEAALLAARSGADLIDMRAIDEAIDRVISGPQRYTRVMNDHEKLVTAYHEGGHALCAAASQYSDPVTKITILPRGRALGYTMVMPSQDRYSITRNQLLDQMVYAMGGRVAEEMIFEDPSTGASNDIQKATNIARKLVVDYGMSEKVGLVKLSADDTDPFYMTPGGAAREHSDKLTAKVDEEIRFFLDQANREAWEILSRNRAVLDELAKRLLEKETLLEDELKEIFAPVIKQKKRQLWSYNRDAAVSAEAFGNPIKVLEKSKPADEVAESLNETKDIEGSQPNSGSVSSLNSLPENSHEQGGKQGQAFSIEKEPTCENELDSHHASDASEGSSSAESADKSTSSEPSLENQENREG